MDRNETEQLKVILNEPKSASQILEEQIETVLHEYKRSNLGLLMSAFTAGLEVGFSIFLMVILYSQFHHTVSSEAMHMLLSLAYPVGFIFIVIGRSELFTEHTTLAILPVLSGQVSVVGLFKHWGIIFIGNIIGGYLFGFLITSILPKLKLVELSAFAHLAEKMIAFEWWVILCSGILAGWLMGLLSWLVTASQDTVGRILLVILVTSIIGVGGLHHSIVGSIEVFCGLITSSEIVFSEYLNFQWWTTLGNIIGGVVFVGVLKYSNINS